jgi:hypothetical protein
VLIGNKESRNANFQRRGAFNNNRAKRHSSTSPPSLIFKYIDQ